MTLTVGSMCTGYAGMELGLALAGIDFELKFVADPDPAARLVLARNHPGVPNLGDITTVDWAAQPPVDVILAGYPCQGFSLAGLRGGINDPRFIWPYIADAVRILRPRWVLLENVPGHRSLGFGRVLGDLAALGYDAQWVSVRACDVGAPHKRERVFISACPAGQAPPARTRGGLAGPGSDPVLIPTPTARLARAGAMSEQTATARAARREGANLDDWGALLVTPTAQLAVNGGSQHPAKRKDGGHGPTLADQIEHLLPTPVATHYGSNQSPTPGAAVCPGLDAIGALLPTPTTSESTGTGRLDGPRADSLRAQVALLPTPTAVDGNRATAHYADQGTTLPDAVAQLPTPRATRGGSATESAKLLPTPKASDSGTEGRRASPGFRPPLSEVVFGQALLPTPRHTDGTKGGPNQRGSAGDLMLPSAVQAERWGAFAPAIARWEQVCGPAPDPTERSSGKRGGQRLAPRFVEWMM